MSWLSHPGLKIVVLLALAALVISRYLVATGRKLPGERWHKPVSVVVVLLALLTFFDRAPWSRGFINYHDLFHQYFGAKYHPEINRFGLYHCTLTALDEVSPQYHVSATTVRDLRTYEMIRKADLLARPPACRSKFELKRWKLFKEDLIHFQRLYHPHWGSLLADKGHNGTPVWNLFGHIVASLVPLRSHGLANLIGLIDWLLMAAAFILVVCTVGWWFAATALLYFAGCTELASGFIRGSSLRLDWLALLLAAVACWWTDRHRLAGVLLGAATMIRAFPALFLFGPALIAVHHLWRHRRIEAADLRLFGGFAITCAVLFTISVVADGGLAGWRDWVAKMWTHDNYVAGYRVGLRQTVVADVTVPAVARDQSPDGKAKRPTLHQRRREALDRRWPVRLVIGLAILGLLGYGLWRLKRLEAAALSFPAIFVLMTLTFYYYCLLTAVVLLLSRRPKSHLAVGVILGLITVQICLHIGILADHNRGNLSFAQSFLLLAVSLATALAVARKKREEQATV